MSKSLLAFAALLLVPCLAASAQVLTNVSFDRTVRIRIGGYDGPATFYVSPDFYGSSLPASGSRQASSPTGSAIDADYDFTDGPLGAEFKIDTTFSIFGDDDGQELAPIGNSVPIEFTTLVPVQYSASFYITGTAIFGTTNAAIGTILNGPDGTVFHDSGAPFQASGTTASVIITESGVLPANQLFNLIVLADLSGSHTSPPFFTDGSASFDLKLTPIPEPTTFVGLVMCSLVWARRRLR